MVLTLEELEGCYESREALGPGMRYVLELDGPRAGVKAGERFVLVASAWSLTGRNVPGTDRPDVRLLGKRRLEGAYRLDLDGMVMHAQLLIDTPGDGAGLGHPPSIRRAVSEMIAVEVAPPPPLALHFKLYGADVLVLRR